mmetsp:Transcript_37828/g.112957  ORF Transcript_37828/g.112957 Transcript_37828/m.112957 type:complete len:216 (-) Transcript_37828:712-1359(-)
MPPLSIQLESFPTGANGHAEEPVVSPCAVREKEKPSREPADLLIDIPGDAAPSRGPRPPPAVRNASPLPDAMSEDRALAGTSGLATLEGAFMAKSGLNPGLSCKAAMYRSLISLLRKRKETGTWAPICASQMSSLRTSRTVTAFDRTICLLAIRRDSCVSLVRARSAWSKVARTRSSLLTRMLSTSCCCSARTMSRHLGPMPGAGPRSVSLKRSL